MPFAGYRDFADCVKRNQDKRDPEGYCAVVMRRVEHPELKGKSEVVKRRGRKYRVRYR